MRFCFYINPLVQGLLQIKHSVKGSCYWTYCSGGFPNSNLKGKQGYDNGHLLSPLHLESTKRAPKCSEKYHRHWIKSFESISATSLLGDLRKALSSLGFSFLICKMILYNILVFQSYILAVIPFLRYSSKGLYLEICFLNEYKHLEHCHSHF